MLHRFADARVIVVDDNPANVSALVAVLGDAGLRNIACATNPRAGLDLASVTDPDVILLDLHMPGLDGYGVLEELAATSGDTGHFPVVVVMGETTPDTLHRALLLGARDFIATPLDPVEVVLRVRNMLENRFLHSALQDQNFALHDELDEMKEDDDRVRIIEPSRRITQGPTHDYVLTSAYIGFLLPLMIELQHLQRQERVES